MELHAAVETRHSIKNGFGDIKEIPRHHLERIVDAGRLAPTGMNKQLWEFIVVSKPEQLSKLSSLKPHTSAAIVLAYDPRKRLGDGRSFHREDLSAATENMLCDTTL